MKDADKVPIQKKKKKESQSKIDFKWVGTIFTVTIVISACLSLLSDSLLSRVPAAAAFAILFLIVLIGILFDIIGVAVTTADERPFHSMAAKNVPAAREAIRLIRNANRVSSFCNDVVGDICGVISGTASAVIAARVIVDFTPTFASFFKLFMSALVSALTVGGKAVGKTFAMNASTPIVHFAADVIFRIKYAFRWISGQFRRKK